MHGLEEIKEMNEQATEAAVPATGDGDVHAARVALNALDFIAGCPVESLLGMNNPHVTQTVLVAIVASAVNAMAFITGEKSLDEYTADEEEFLRTSLDVVQRAKEQALLGMSLGEALDACERQDETEDQQEHDDSEGTTDAIAA